MTLTSERTAVADLESGLQFVTPAEFIRHLTSHSRMVRADEPEANLIGLKDCDTGMRYVVPFPEFARFQADGHQSGRRS